MVMTNTVRPRVSVAGMVLVVSLACTGWLTTPAWSSPCPADEKVKETKVKQEKHACGQPELIVTSGKPPKRLIQKTCPSTCQDKSTYERHVLGTAPGAIVAPALPMARLAVPAPPAVSLSSSFAVPAPFYAIATVPGEDDDELAKQLERLDKELKRLSAELRELRRAAGTRAAGRATRSAAPRAATRRSAAGVSAGRRGAGGTTVRGGRVVTAPESDGVIVRTYKLPAGKAKALGGLMIRDDVPIPVRPLPEGIEVHATAAQHKVFKTFVELIHPVKGAQAPEKRVRTQAGTSRYWDDATETYREALKRSAAGKAREQLERAREQGTQYRKALEAQARAAAAAASRQLAGQAAAIEAQVDALEAQAERFEAEAEKLMAHAEALAGKAEDVDNADKARALEREARDVERQARRLEAEARKVEGKVRALERQAERLESEAESTKTKAQDKRKSQSKSKSRGRSDAKSPIPSELLESLRTDVPHAVAEALRKASGTIRKDAQPAVADAFRAAAKALREDSSPAATKALKEAARKLRRGRVDHPLAERILERVAKTLESDAPPAVAGILARVAEALEKDAPAAADKILEEVAETLEAEAKAQRKPKRR